MKKIKMHYLDPQEPLHDGIQNKRRISKEEALKTFPTEVIQNQIPATSKGRKNEKN